MDTTVGCVDIVPMKLGYNLRVFRNGAFGSDTAFEICSDHVVRPNLSDVSPFVIKYGLVDILLKSILEISGFWTTDTGDKKTEVARQEISIDELQLISWANLHTEYGYKFIGPESFYKLTIPEIDSLYTGSSLKGQYQKEKEYQESGSSGSRTHATPHDERKFDEYLDKNDLR